MFLKKTLNNLQKALKNWKEDREWERIWKIIDRAQETGKGDVTTLIKLLEPKLWRYWFPVGARCPRTEAALALGRIGDRRAAGPLMLLLQHKDPSIEVRFYAAFALGLIGDDSAVEALISALDDQGEYGFTTVAEEAAEALQKIAEKSHIQIDENAWQRAKHIIAMKPILQTQRQEQHDRAAMAADPHLCDRALQCMRRLIEQNYASPSPPYPVQVHDELVNILSVLCEVALQKRQDGIAIPAEVQVIQEVYRNRHQMSAAMWIIFECEKALKKLGAL